MKRKIIVAGVALLLMVSMIAMTALAASNEPVQMDEEYYEKVLAALNECREFQGNRALGTTDELNEMALAHAMEMAKAGKLFHSTYTKTVKYSLCESVRYGDVDAMHPVAVGARSAVHAPRLQNDSTIIAYGIGCVEYNGKIYACILGKGQDF